jgi:5'-nucleotidase
MNKIRIGIDLDSTMSDLLPYWLNKYNQDYNDNLQQSDITDWDTSKFVKPECGKKIFDYIEQPNFFSNVPVIPNSQNVIQWLSTFDNVELYVVTAFNFVACEDKGKWIIKHFPFINPKNIIFCNPKFIIDVDYLIDDSPFNHIGFKGQYILFDMDYPYNQCLGDMFPRMKSWLEIRDYFKKIIV